MSLTSYRAAPPRVGLCLGPRILPGLDPGTGGGVRPFGSRGLAGALASYEPDVPGLDPGIAGCSTPRWFCVWAPGSSPGLAGVRAWRAWRRPTLPRLETQYHRR